MDKHTATEVAYHNGYAAGLEKGYEAGKLSVLDEIDDILDRCALDNPAMIVQALKELKSKLEVK